MEISPIGSIWTPFGEVELTPQDRNLLQVTSAESLQFGDLRFDLWALLELTHETWSVSDVVAPVLRLIGQSAHSSSSTGESVRAEVMKSVAALAGEWALAHPEGFECAAAAAFEFDQEGLDRELGELGESLTCSAHAVEAIASAALSEHSGRLREYSQKMRKMASDVPVILEIAQRISYPDERPGRASNLVHSALEASAGGIKSKNPSDVGGWRDNSNLRVLDGGGVSRQSRSSIQLTLGQILRNRREEMRLSQRELAFKLGIDAEHIAELESDCGTRPSFPLLRRAADALGLEKDLLFQLAETGMRSISGARKVAPNPQQCREVFAAFARNRNLLARFNVKPQELKALSQVSLMGKVADTEALLFILEAIRKAGDDD